MEHVKTWPMRRSNDIHDGKQYRSTQKNFRSAVFYFGNERHVYSILGELSR